MATQVRTRMKTNWNKVACMKVVYAKNTMHSTLMSQIFSAIEK